VVKSQKVIYSQPSDKPIDSLATINTTELSLLSIKMGVVSSIKKNKVGAVVVSVFDWYRKLTKLGCPFLF
jgi:hypothetical protein